MKFSEVRVNVVKFSEVCVKCCEVREVCVNVVKFSEVCVKCCEV